MDKIVAGRKKVKLRGHILEVFLEQRISSPLQCCSNRKLNKTAESMSNVEPGGKNTCFLVLFRNIYQTSRIGAIFGGGARLLLDVDWNCAGLLVTSILLLYVLNDSVVIVLVRSYALDPLKGVLYNCHSSLLVASLVLVYLLLLLGRGVKSSPLQRIYARLTIFSDSSSIHYYIMSWHDHCSRSRRSLVFTWPCVIPILSTLQKSIQGIDHSRLYSYKQCSGYQIWVVDDTSCSGMKRKTTTRK